jgi:hypothetical protein
LRISRNNKGRIAAGYYSFNDLDINQHVDNPEGKERREDAGGEFRFKPRPLSITGTDSDGLKYMQERGGADGKTPQLCRCTKLPYNPHHWKNA